MFKIYCYFCDSLLAFLCFYISLKRPENKLTEDVLLSETPSQSETERIRYPEDGGLTLAMSSPGQPVTLGQ